MVSILTFCLILPGRQMCNDEAYLRQPTEDLQ